MLPHNDGRLKQLDSVRDRSGTMPLGSIQFLSIGPVGHQRPVERNRDQFQQLHFDMICKYPFRYDAVRSLVEVYEFWIHHEIHSP
jgi:hypothetical protein